MYSPFNSCPRLKRCPSFLQSTPPPSTLSPQRFVRITLGSFPHSILVCSPPRNPMPKRILVESHTTSRGQKRILIRFAHKPSYQTLNSLRVHAKYRKGKASEAPAWYLPLDRFDVLRDEVQTVQTQELAKAMDAFTQREQVPSADCPACTRDALLLAQGIRRHGASYEAHTLLQPHCWFCP
jgi:hypothetical protein